MVTLQQVNQRQWKYPELWEGVGYSALPSLNCCQGGQLLDLSNNGFIGSLKNATLANAWNNPQVNGITFDGSISYVDCGPVNCANTAFSVSLWVKATSKPSSGIIIGRYTQSPVYCGWYLQTGSGIFEVMFRKDAGDYWNYYSDSNWFANTGWYHCVLTYPNNGSVPQMFRNSTLLSLSPDAGAVGNALNGIANPTQNLWLGASAYAGGTLYYPGSIDDVRIYNRALSTAEISLLYSGGYGRGIAYTQKTLQKGRLAPPVGGSTIFRRGINSRSGARASA